MIFVCCVMMTESICETTNKLTKSVTDPGFPQGGGGREPSKGGAWTHNFAEFSQKLHKIERIWMPRGGRASLTPPLDPPLQMVKLIVIQAYFRREPFVNLCLLRKCKKSINFI